MASNKDTWSPADVLLLQEMDTAGIRLAWIAAKLGRTKSAVWRKRKALRLAPRRSPIKRAAGPGPAKPVGKGPTLPILASLRGEVS